MHCNNTIIDCCIRRVCSWKFFKLITCTTYTCYLLKKKKLSKFNKCIVDGRISLFSESSYYLMTRVYNDYLHVSYSLCCTYIVPTYSICSLCVTLAYTHIFIIWFFHCYFLCVYMYVRYYTIRHRTQHWITRDVITIELAGGIF